MYKITLEIANNGVIKTIEDDNSNGGGESLEEKVVYQLENDGENDFEKTLEFLAEIAEDLGIDLGSKHTRKRVKLDTEYGESYTLNDAELKAEIDLMQFELKWMKAELKERNLAKKKNQ